MPYTKIAHNTNLNQEEAKNLDMDVQLEDISPEKKLGALSNSHSPTTPNLLIGELPHSCAFKWAHSTNHTTPQLVSGWSIRKSKWEEEEIHRLLHDLHASSSYHHHTAKEGNNPKHWYDWPNVAWIPNARGTNAGSKVIDKRHLPYIHRLQKCTQLNRPPHTINHNGGHRLPTTSFCGTHFTTTTPPPPKSNQSWHYTRRYHESILIQNVSRTTP